MLERDTELRALRDALKSAAAGEGATVVLEGPAGIGKTSLLTALGQAARVRGLRLLRARGAEFEWALPFGVARQLFAGDIAGEELEPSAGTLDEEELAARMYRCGLRSRT